VTNDEKMTEIDKISQVKTT